MPGMMDTVLNLGLNDEVVTGLAAKSGERFAYDSYRRFLDMFGDVVNKFLFYFNFFKLFQKNIIFLRQFSFLFEYISGLSLMYYYLIALTS